MPGLWSPTMTVSQDNSSVDTEHQYPNQAIMQWVEWWNGGGPGQKWGQCVEGHLTSLRHHRAGQGTRKDQLHSFRSWLTSEVGADRGCRVCCSPKQNKKTTHTTIRLVQQTSLSASYTSIAGLLLEARHLRLTGCSHTERWWWWWWQQFHRALTMCQAHS